MSIEAGPTRAPVYARLAALGFGLFIVGIAMAVAAAVISGNLGDVLPYALISIALALGAVYAMLRRRGWTYSVGLILGILGLLFFGEDSYAFAAPDAFFDFVGALLGVVGSLIAAVASIAALVQERRRQPRYALRSGERSALVAGLTLLAALVALSAVLTLAGRDSVPADQEEGALRVQMKATEFRPRTLEVPAGQPVRILVKNSDAWFHRFKIEALNVNTKFGPGDEKLIEFIAPVAGSYEYSSDVPRQKDMKGTLVVR